MRGTVNRAPLCFCCGRFSIGPGQLPLFPFRHGPKPDFYVRSEPLVLARDGSTSAAPLSIASALRPKRHPCAVVTGAPFMRCWRVDRSPSRKPPDAPPPDPMPSRRRNIEDLLTKPGRMGCVSPPHMPAERILRFFECRASAGSLVKLRTPLCLAALIQVMDRQKTVFLQPLANDEISLSRVISSSSPAPASANSTSTSKFIGA
ncbi:hypothetical protein ABIE76_001986 [Sinorhizobium fredii]